MFESSYRVCPLCNSNKKSLIRKMTNTMSRNMMNRTGYPMEYGIVSCDMCGMVFSDIDIDDDKIDNYYSNENMYNNMSDVKSYLYAKSQEMYYKYISKYIYKDSMIVDVGCGSGNLLYYLKQKGYIGVLGIDPSKESIAVLNKNEIEGVIGTVYDCDKLNCEPADMVISTGVLEHLLYPQKALRCMKQLMKDNGHLYICVPAAEKYCDTPLPEANFFNHEHINHFTEQSLIMMAETVGLKAVYSNVEKACEEMEDVINVLFVKSSTVMNKEKKSISSIYAGKQSIEKYFHERCEQEEKINKVIMNLIKSKTDVVIWGTGNYACSILNRFTELKDNVLFFLDNNKQRIGYELYNKKIYTPDIMQNTTNSIIKDATILVCVMQSKEAIAKDITTMKLSNKIIYL